VLRSSSTCATNHLVVTNWDQRIIDHLVRRFAAQTASDLSQDRWRAVASVEAPAERRRSELVLRDPRRNINPGRTFTGGSSGPLHLEHLAGSRSEFQRIRKDLLDRTKGSQFRARRSGCRRQDRRHRPPSSSSALDPHAPALDHDLVQGGCSAAKEPNKGVNPDEVVRPSVPLFCCRWCSRRGSRTSAARRKTPRLSLGQCEVYS